MKLKEIAQPDKRQQIIEQLVNWALSIGVGFNAELLREFVVVNADGSVHLNEYVEINSTEVPPFPVAINSAKGLSFNNCDFADGFVFPQRITQELWIEGCHNLPPFAHFPKYVHTLHLRTFDERPNYKDFHKHVSAERLLIMPGSNMVGLTLVKGLESLVIVTAAVDSKDKQLEDILSRNIGDPLQAQEEMMDAGFKQEARL